MKRLLTQWALTSGVLCLLAVLALILFTRSFLELSEPMLEAWFWCCKIVTPKESQTLGNIPLALAWVFSGLAIYSMLLGAILVVSSEGIKKLRIPKNRQ